AIHSHEPIHEARRLMRRRVAGIVMDARSWLVAFRLDRRWEPWSGVLLPAAASQHIARAVQSHLDEPRSEAFIDTARRPLDHSQERVLHDVVRVRCAASHPIAQAPEEAAMLV